VKLFVITYVCVEFVSDGSDVGSVEAIISELSNHNSRWASLSLFHTVQFLLLHYTDTASLTHQSCLVTFTQLITSPAAVSVLWLCWCSVAERKQAMAQLIRLSRDSHAELMSQHFKTILLLLLETLADVNVRYSVSFSACHRDSW